MNKESGQQPQGEFDEALAEYHDLARARDLFINLFQDKDPLVKLGYTARQIEFALPVLKLLEGEGKVATYIPNNPFLDFSSNDPFAEELQVYYLPNREGFYLFAVRDEGLRGWGELSRDQRLMRILTARQPVVIFPDFPEQVAHIGLFKEGADIDNLDYLVRQFFDKTFTDAPMGVKAENLLTRAARAIGVAGTYKAAWVEEETKREFVAKVDVPEDKKFGSIYVTYRKLEPRSDLRGGIIIPIGKKANTSEKKVTQILSERNKHSVSGKLVLGNVMA